MATTSPLQLIDSAVGAAVAANEVWAHASRDARANCLRALADALSDRREPLVALADRETSLGAARLNGELDRTQFQLRAFADLLDHGAPWRMLDDAAVSGAPPAGRPRIVRVQRAIGPVAMFAASNFPFAFSVLGGDTVSALAAGCPVVVKAHPGHPQLSRAMFDLASEVLRRLQLPAGVLRLVEGGIEVGQRLVRHPEIAAVAFTGSFRGGQSLWRETQARPRPIPFYGELGSVNPVVALPEALLQHADALAKLLASSITLGCGQFCTSPGLLLVPSDPRFDGFVSALAEALGGHKPHAMLTPAIRKGFDDGVQRWGEHPAVALLLRPAPREAEAPTPVLAQTTAAAVLADEHLREEVFGPAALVVRCSDLAETIETLKAVGGALTVTVWGAEKEGDDALRVIEAAEQIAGRVLFSGVPTGVAVCAAQHHGGPWPASTAPHTTSVGFAAIERFLRPVALQDPPAWLLGRERLSS